MTQTIKNLPAMQETWLCSLGREDPLERGMAIHTGILAWRIPWTEMAAVVSRSRTSAQHVQPLQPTLFTLNWIPQSWETASLANLSCYCLSWIHCFFWSDKTPSVCLKSEVKGDSVSSQGPLFSSEWQVFPPIPGPGPIFINLSV